MSRGIAVDLGTANTLVYGQGRGVLLNEPTVIAVNHHNGEVLAMGHEAYAMIGRTPGHIVAERPLRGGAVTDFDATAKLLKLLFQRVQGGRTVRWGKPRVIICVPSAVTNVERRAVEEAATEAGAGEVHLMEEPMAAAIGAGLPVQEPFGSMVVDIGGGTSEVAIVALGGVVVSRAVRVGGFDLDAAVQRYVRDAYALAIGERTAEELKITLGSAVPLQPEQEADIRGRELATGLPRHVTVGSAELRAALDDQVGQIVRAVVETLGECPPELTQDIIDEGLWLTGGGALLHGLAERVAQETHVTVNVIDKPLEAVAIGAGSVLDSFRDLQKVFQGTSTSAMHR
nr:rod shape-determining protein [Egibacter rhizosphaerae]